MKLAIAIPTFKDNPENDKIRDEIDACRGSYGDDLDIELQIFMEAGERIPVTGAPLSPEYNDCMIRRDREIARCRWKAMTDSFAAGADWCLMLDTDLYLPTDFLWHMVHAWSKTAEAKTCHIRSTEDDTCRHVGFPSSVKLPDDIDTQPIAGEVIMLKRSLWERMDHTFAAYRAHEDYEIAEKVRAAGAVYHLVDVICYAD